MATNPGMRVSISRKGIDYGAQQAVNVLSRDMNGKTFDKITGDGHHIRYEMTNLRIKSFTTPTSSVSTSPFTWVINGVAASLSSDWHYWYKKGWVKLSDHGSMDASLRASISVTISMGVDGTGRPTIASAGSHCDVSDLHIHVHGGASFLYNALVGMFKGKIKDTLERELCKAVEKVINVNAAQELATMKVAAPINDYVTIDYRFVEAPQFSVNAIEADLKGEFFWVGDSQECPLTPGPLDAAPEMNMVSFWLTEYSINTLAYINYKHDMLHYNLTKDDLPEKQRGILNTTCTNIFTNPCIGGLIPQIAKAYPNTTVKIQMDVTQAPTIHVTPSGINGKWVGDVNFLTYDDEKKRDVSLIQCDVTVTFNLTVAMKGMNITTNIKEFKTDLVVKSSTVGKIDSEKLTVVLNTAIQWFVLPKLNEIGETGFQLPNISDVEFVNPQLRMLDGSLFITVDLKYQGYEVHSLHRGRDENFDL